MLKLYTKNKKWIVVDGERSIEFDTAREAWDFVFLMRGMRPKMPQAPKTLHPVNTLEPSPSRRIKKKIFLTIS